MADDTKPGPSAADLDDLVAAVRASPRYHRVAAELVQRVVASESSAARDRRTILKAAKRKLHQAIGAFGGEPPYPRLLERLRTAYSGGDAAAHEAACLEVLRWHASTRERIPILHDFYRRIFAVTGPARVIQDLGCGLGPLALPWMSLPEDALYHSCDADEAGVDFVGAYFAIAGVRGHAEARDVLVRPPTEPADIAFLLKLLPTLEQQERGGSLRLLDALNARFVVVSTPVRSLGGREKGMIRGYERQVGGILAARPWRIERLSFTTELVWVVEKA